MVASAVVARAAADGITPLMLAAAADDVEKIESLIASGAAVDVCDARGHTAIWHAVDARKPAALALLLDKASKLTRRCALGRGALERAFALDDWALIEPLLVAGRANLGWTTAARQAMAKAINTRNGEHVKLLVAKHWRDPMMDGSRYPIIAHAVVSGDLETMTFLLDCGFNPNTRVGNFADREFADRIPQKFIRYYVKNDRGVNVLMLSAGMERVEFVKALLARGARESSCTLRHKMAALSFAAEANNHEIMRALFGSAPLPSQLRVEISLSSQNATLYKDGQAIESTTISTGVQGKETKSGKFIVTNKEPMHISNIYKGAKMPWFMRLNCGDFGMHQGIVTGAPASHGCIRLPAAIAKKWYGKVPLGTEVSIY
jgi:lipoprotein-anchoring transpeptidase ErfK/SrfK